MYGYLWDVKHALLFDLFPWHDEQQPLEVIGGDLVEDDLDIELVV
jgi:hypothetical protein